MKFESSQRSQLHLFFTLIFHFSFVIRKSTSDYPNLVDLAEFFSKTYIH